MRKQIAALALALGTAGLAACDNPVADSGHRVASDVVITEADGTTEIARTRNNATWEGGPLELRAGEARVVRIFFVSPAGERFQLPAVGATHTLYVGVTDAGVAGFEPTSLDRGRFLGTAPGTSSAVVYLWHGEHPRGHEDFQTPPLQLRVTQ